MTALDDALWDMLRECDAIAAQSNDRMVSRMRGLVHEARTAALSTDKPNMCVQSTGCVCHRLRDKDGD